MALSAIKLTFDEYLNYKNETENRYEYQDGELLEMPPGTGLHEKIIFFLAFQFQLEIKRLKSNLQVRPSGVEIKTSYRGKTQSRKPDVLLMTSDQDISILKTTAILYTPPPLVVEVVSPESVKRDYERKRLEYAELGINEYWIVDPLKNVVSVLTLVNDGYEQRECTGTDRIVSLTFPELTLTAEEILAGN